MDQRTKQNVRAAMQLYFNNIGAVTPDQIMINLDGAWQYLLKLGLVKPEHYSQYIYAAETQYKFRGF